MRTRTRQEFRVMLFIDGAESPSSCIANGTRAQCDGVAGRLNRRKDKHPSYEWRVLPCIQ